MKKRVICLFSLILYLLLACTVLSIKIESEMMTQVKLSERENRGDSFSVKQSALFSDGQGEHFYEAVDGTGWDSGLRVREISSAAWYIDAYGSVTFDGSRQRYRFIYSASRQPREGEEVAVIEESAKGNDRYLYFYADGVPEEFILPKNSEITAQTEHALLLDMSEAEFPFFRHTAAKLTASTELADHVFSLTEVEQFLEVLPYVAMVVVFLIVGVVFGGAACLFSTYADGSRLVVWMNVVFAIVSLGCMAIMLNMIELPASVLPVDSIFDWQYYKEEFSIIFNALDSLEMTDLLYMRDAVTSQCLALIRYAALVVFVVVIIEIVIQRMKIYKASP